MREILTCDDNFSKLINYNQIANVYIILTIRINKCTGKAYQEKFYLREVVSFMTSYIQINYIYIQCIFPRTFALEICDVQFTISTFC